MNICLLCFIPWTRRCLLQAEVLRRVRRQEYKSEAERRLLEDALIVTINGIANGQKNTG